MVWTRIKPMENLPQWFMQIGRMECDFRNSKNLVKSCNLSKCWLIPCMPPSHVVLCYSLWCHNGTTVYLIELHKFHKISLFMKMYLPFTFIIRYVRAKTIVQAFVMNLSNQTNDIQEEWKIVENLCQWRGRLTNLLNRLSKFAQIFTVAFLILLSTHPLHIVVWGNCLFNDWHVK